MIKFAFGFDTVLHEIIQFEQIVLARDNASVPITCVVCVGVCVVSHEDLEF